MALLLLLGTGEGAEEVGVLSLECLVALQLQVSGEQFGILWVLQGERPKLICNRENCVRNNGRKGAPTSMDIMDKAKGF